MKASIHDRQALAAIRPLELVAYLRSTGWRQARVMEDRWETWIKNGDFEIALPLMPTVGDFASRMADALKTLEAAEDRSQLEILNDLLTSSADILRFRPLDTEATDGTIPIDEGAQLVQQARDFMMAGACAAIQRRAVFQTRKPNQAVEYLKKVRMGQTERGSYVVTVISRVAPVLRVEDPDALFEMEEPYERQVTRTLSKAVVAAQRAARSAAATGNFSEFQATVHEGVSANLCDAIRGLATGGEPNRGIEISFSWSRSRPIEGESFSRVVFSPDSMPVIEEAARLFRETSARDEFELRGPVVKLERAEGASTGRVTILGFVDQQPRKVILDLEDEDYHRAVQAHDHQQTVFCLGALVREGRAYALKNPHAFEIEPDA